MTPDGRRARALERMACLVYSTLTVQQPMMPPWSHLTDEQREPFRNDVRSAVRGEHPQFEFHQPDSPPREDSDEPIDWVEP